MTLRILGTFAALAAASLIAACDPCAGTADCHTADRISYSGRVVDHGSGIGAGGTVVTFVRSDGTSLTSDTLRAITDADGFFKISIDAVSAGTVKGVLVVRPPGKPGYTTDTLSLQTTNVGGDGGDLGRFVTEPYIMFVAEVRSRALGSSGPVPTPLVVLRRTGGIEIDSTLIIKVGDESGRLFFAPTPKHAGVLQAELTITAPTLTRAFVVPVTIKTRYLDAPAFSSTPIPLGTALVWAGQVYRRGSAEFASNIDVDFQRTGGIIVTPASFTTKTNAVGLFPIQPVPDKDGELVGDVTIRPPAPMQPVTYRGIRVRTYDDDSVRTAGRFAFGPQAFGGITFINRTTMLPFGPGGVVTFRRTGGVRTTTETFAERVNAFGAARIQLAADTPGELVGDVEVRLGEPYGTDVVRGVRLVSAEDETQRSLGAYLVGRWFPDIAQLLDGQTGRPIPGARVSFRRTSGINIQPDPFVVTPNPDGMFPIRPQPLADGEVVGDLTFELPSPYQNFSVQGIRLRSSMNDSLRFIRTWLAAPR